MPIFLSAGGRQHTRIGRKARRPLPDPLALRTDPKTAAGTTSAADPDGSSSITSTTSADSAEGGEELRGSTDSEMPASYPPHPWDDPTCERPGPFPLRPVSPKESDLTGSDSAYADHKRFPAHTSHSAGATIATVTTRVGICLLASILVAVALAWDSPTISALRAQVENTPAAASQSAGDDNVEPARAVDVTANQSQSAENMPIAHDPFDHPAVATTAASWQVMDAQTGDLIAAEQIDRAVSAASTQKLFTVEYAVSRLSLDDVLSVDEETLLMPPDNSSLAGIVPGEYTLRELLTGLLLPSGNDAAYAIAVGTGRDLLNNEQAAPQDALAAYVEGLAQFLADHGYNDTHISEPSGLNTVDRSTVRDVSRVVTALMTKQWFRDIVAMPAASVQTSTGEYQWKNTNYFLDPDKPQYDPHVYGVKTGSIPDLFNIVTAYRADSSDEYLLFVYGSATDEDRYADTRLLIDTFITDK